jgi:hypothetical protein
MKFKNPEVFGKNVTQFLEKMLRNFFHYFFQNVFLKSYKYSIKFH